MYRGGTLPHCTRILWRLSLCENHPILNFRRSHRNVLRGIAKIRANCPESFYGLNFEPVEYVDSKGEKRPAYLLTRDAFSLLVMGFTGSCATSKPSTRWKPLHWKTGPRRWRTWPARPHTGKVWMRAGLPSCPACGRNAARPRNWPCPSPPPVKYCCARPCAMRAWA